MMLDTPRRALSIKQPWVYAITHLGKDIENRSWRTKFRGRFAIHAARTDAPEEDWLEVFDKHPRPRYFPIGQVVATADLVECIHPLDKNGKAYHKVKEYFRSPWYQGRVGFVMRDVRVLREGIPVKGRLGFWKLPREVIHEIARQEQEASND